MERAWDLAATGRGLDRYRRQAARGTAAGAALIVLGLVFALLPVDGSLPSELAAGLGGTGLICFGIGLGALRNAGRMRRALAAGPWSAHPAVLVVRGGLTGPSLVLSDPEAGLAWPLTMAATKQRYERVRPGPDAVLWWCGDPERGGVIAAPGGEELVWTRPVRGHHTRHRTVSLAADAGLFERPAPVQPQGPRVRAEAAAGRGRSAGAPVVFRPRTPDGSPDAGAAVVRPAVVSPDAAPAVVSPDAAPAVGPEAGTPAPGARERRLPTYAVLSAAALRQALPQNGRPRREADVRAVPWWRVRTLRWVSGLTRLLVSPVPAGVGLLILFGPRNDYPALIAYAFIALGVGLFLHSGHRFLTSGRAAARLLARAARAPVPAPKRYALLFDPVGGAPVLVLFPYGGGADDPPEALLHVYPTGTQKQPRKGLPSAPAGVLELHGWLDRTEAGEPFVVPWIEGRPLWPAGPYEELRPGDPAALAYLERLAPPQEAVPAP